MNAKVIEVINKIINQGLTAEVKINQNGEIVVLEVHKHKQLPSKPLKQNIGLSN